MIAVVFAPPGSSQTYLVDCFEHHSSPEADVESRSNDRIGDTRRGKKKHGYPLLKLFLSWSLYGYPAMGSALVQLPRGSFKRLLTFLFAPSTDHPGVLLLLPLAVPATLQRHAFAGGVLCNGFLWQGFRSNENWRSSMPPLQTTPFNQHFSARLKQVVTLDGFCDRGFIQHDSWRSAMSPLQITRGRCCGCCCITPFQRHFSAIPSQVASQVAALHGFCDSGFIQHESWCSAMSPLQITRGRCWCCLMPFNQHFSARLSQVATLHCFLR